MIYGKHQILCNRVSVTCDNSYLATDSFDFRFAKLDWAEHKSVMLTGCKRLSASRVGCVFLTSPPLAKDILCSVWVP